MFTIFKTFFWLGWFSFGGPAAHIGYFRQTFVEKLKWLDDSEYAQIVALSQFLPGPGSSQVGFALGYKRGGLGGACAAFVGFTLPSVIIMLALAMVSSQITDTAVFQNIVHGLKLLAVVVVADATWGMYKNFCQSKLTAGLCVATAIALLVAPSIMTQMFVLIAAGFVGTRYLKKDSASSAEPFKPSIAPLALFAVLLLGLPLVAHSLPLLGLFSDFFQAGSLVFGGGHVVLPLLQNIVGDQLSQDAFLTGYAAAQAVPGPMFTFATFIGYELSDTPILGALIATLGVFLPGFLLLLGVLKNWQALAGKPLVSGAINGVNASVVGLLLAALYQPVFSSAVVVPIDMALVVAGCYLHKKLNLSVLWMIVFFVAAGLVTGMM
ncbi:TPA: chromate efflux transporter [Vibrio parahaemolyticus]|uniref:chromate efflux transporter n=1 Tax=Vibrio parahaemolyticus TaxID=670 RepID=UPI00038E2D0C|nr:chromate efflux transporter [Vibrio parahaemolyticus]EGR1119897.1 chromate efflux transporter [Vibrio parahaemolyticus]EQM14703.1 chromate transporter, chromate ion transporter family protein [Vibrio parahaemolyticus 3259]ETJ89186.1 chromate transporter, chromate ion transporter family protein [Vibrio parahaemolyticus EKP-008]HCH2417675.1 chromate efflux transporter [Vibrio parahaemolyticus]